jgi:hypothetical protein
VKEESRRKREKKMKKKEKERRSLSMKAVSENGVISECRRKYQK